MSELDARYRELIGFVRDLYPRTRDVPLHAPMFAGCEKQYVLECIDSTFVSSVGAFVDRFESMMRDLTGARHAIATVNGTAALHIALILAGVTDNDEVITQPLSFVATCNAIRYERAHPVFVDVDLDTMSLSPRALEAFLAAHAERRPEGTFNRLSGRRIAAVVPMHTFGMAGRTSEIARLCRDWDLALIEDTAESLGSTEGDRHTGRNGLVAAFSFNGNKIATCGGGGCVITDDEQIGRRAKHLTTTAKRSHRWEFFHDSVAYNYRLPNLNAALACAQLEQLPGFLENKRGTAAAYREFCAQHDIRFIDERPDTASNFWLNAVMLKDRAERDAFLAASNDVGVMTRPIWTLMTHLPAFEHCHDAGCPNAQALEDRIVNLPSSVRP